jgi:glycosyltransferase involved in cell wall biosynthesis
VPSQFNVDTFQKSGVDPAKLVIVPESVDTDFYDPSKYKSLNLSAFDRKGATIGDLENLDDIFIFLSIFKWEERKGWSILLEAYLQEFTVLDPVLLCIKTEAYHEESGSWQQVRDLQLRLMGQPYTPNTAFFSRTSWITHHTSANSTAFQEFSRRLPRLLVIDRHISSSTFPRLFKSAHAFVLPSHGEGWGRPHVEAMAMGLPVIATNWSGTTAFLNSGNGYPLPIEGKLVTPGVGGAFQGHKWAQPSLTHLRRVMRHVSENRAEALEKGRVARSDMLKYYRPEVVSKLVLVQLQRVWRILAHNASLAEPGVQQHQQP